MSMLQTAVVLLSCTAVDQCDGTPLVLTTDYQNDAICQDQNDAICQDSREQTDTRLEGKEAKLAYMQT